MAANNIGPTARVKQYAASQPGAIISWSEARDAYRTGVTKNWCGDYVPSVAYHNMSISNVLHRHFEMVEGARGLHVLLTSMNNYNVEDDMDEMRKFHAIYGCDEFGRSTRDCPLEEATSHPLTHENHSCNAECAYDVDCPVY